MLKQFRERRRSLKSVRSNLIKILWQVQALEWALLYLESPFKGKGERWRIQTPRTLERSLKRSIESLTERLKEYGVKPEQVKPIRLSPNSKIPRKILEEYPISLHPVNDNGDDPGDPRLEYKFGGADPRFDELSALELFSLGRYGTREPDPEL